MKNLGISLIVPFYNEAEALDIFFQEILALMNSHSYSFEIICINDGSKDNTASKLEVYADKYPNIKVISFSKNFGKEIALSAGLEHCSGQCAILIDADLQHPIDKIPEFIARWQDGYKIVYGIKISRKHDSFTKKLSAKLFYKFHNLISEANLTQNASDFILLDRVAIDTINRYQEKDRFMRILCYSVGFKSCTVEYDINARSAGTTKFNYWKLWNFAIDGIISSSTIPLRIWTYIGVAIASLGFVLGLITVIKTLIYGIDSPGYLSIFLSVLFFGGIQLIALGVLGEYIGRITTQVKNRPLYIIESKKNLDDL